MYSRQELKELETNIKDKLNELKQGLVENSKKIIYLEGQLQKINDIRKTI